jgi:hypothetical protein
MTSVWCLALTGEKAEERGSCCGDLLIAFMLDLDIDETVAAAA